MNIKKDLIYLNKDRTEEVYRLKNPDNINFPYVLICYSDDPFRIETGFYCMNEYHLESWKNRNPEFEEFNP